MMNEQSIYNLFRGALNRNISVIVAVLFLLTSCSFEGNGVADGNASVTLSVASVSQPEVITKSVSAISSGNIGLFFPAYGNDGPKNNVMYTYNSPFWTTDNRSFLDTDAAKVYAYYPYSVSVTNATSVALTSQKYAAAQDLSYDSRMVSASDPEVSFIMKRAYSKITFTIKRDATYGTACGISNISIANAGGIKTATTLDITNGQYAAGIAGKVSYNPGIASIASGASAATSVLMVPVTTAMTGNITLTFTIDGVPVTTTIDAVSSGLTTLDAGTNYNIPVTVKGASVVVGSVNITDWADIVTVNIGDLTKPIVNPQPESNSYIVAPGATISIPVSRVTSAGVTTLTSTWTSGVLWGAECLSGAPVNASKAYITVKASNTQGNAVVYIKNNSGTIIWSWHIWVTGYDPNTTNLTAGGYTWMDRDLGSLANYPQFINGYFNVDSYGLFYQWGRKDPFPISGASKIDATKNLTFAINNPDVFIAMNGDDHSSLNAGTWNIGKTLYDPCPSGWKVPPVSAWNDVSITGEGDAESGYYLSDYEWYPFGGELISWNGGRSGRYAIHWSNSESASMMVGAGSSFVSYSTNSVPASGFNIRCIKQ